MRREQGELLTTDNGVTELPADPESVIGALTELVTDSRKERIEQVLASRKRSVIPVIEDVVDPHNASAVLRSAEAFGVQEVHFIENIQPFLAAKRVTQGTDKWLDLVRHDSTDKCLSSLRKRGYEIYVAAADGPNAVHLHELEKKPKVAVVFGNEHLGASAELREKVDGQLAVPMCGFVESLNLSVAAAITLYALAGLRKGDLSEEDRTALRARFMFDSVPRADEIVRERLARQVGKS